MNRRLKVIFLVIGILLIIPLLIMQISDEVSWKVGDFLIMGVLLTGTGLLCEYILQKVPKVKHRVLLCVVVIGGFLLVWAELAVGILDTPFAGS